MSSPFNYDIDERNLRSKLKDMNIPFKEEAWVQFESYSEGFKSTHKTSQLPDFHLNINRNLILPVLFGAGIILFSMLLFNFVSIGNKKPVEKAEKIISKPEPSPEKTKPEAKEIVPAKAETDTVITQEKKATEEPAGTQIASIATTPTLAPVTETTPDPVSPAENTSLKGSWTIIEEGDIYKNPDIKSEIIGSSSGNKTVSALEETNYFIKISFTKNNQAETGYIRKNIVRRNGGQEVTSSAVKKNRTRKAETMETIQTPVVLPTSSNLEKEPELK